jgi:hypothetical protein
MVRAMGTARIVEVGLRKEDRAAKITPPNAAGQ